ncbi:MAG: hypothetical protein HOP19_19610 [Acidobacteria bacterium]|nr:hypothetical protein [Acidobacteriota bacterium]
MKSATKPPRKKANESLSVEKAPKTSRAVPVPAGLEKWLEWVNAVPIDAKTISELNDKPDKPDKHSVHVKKHLRILMKESLKKGESDSIFWKYEPKLMSELQKEPDEGVPDDAPPPTHNEIIDLADRTLRSHEEINRIPEEALSSLPLETRQKIVEGIKDFDDFLNRQTMRLRYDFWIKFSRLIRNLARNKEPNAEWVFPDLAILERAENGALRLKNDDVLQDILSVGAEVDRIRECPFCLRIFWAGHGNKQRCGETCSDALNDRVYREKHKEQISKQRKKKYQEKKKAAQNSAPKKGTR